MPKSISQEFLKTLLEYDPETGIFTWISGNKGHEIGDIAGTVLDQGGKTKYLVIHIDGDLYRAHRLAFLYMIGEIPNLVDHVDRNGLNNKWANLRYADKRKNSVNVGVRTDNVSGFKGVSCRSDGKRNKKWRAVVIENGRQRIVGSF